MFNIVAYATAIYSHLARASRPLLVAAGLVPLLFFAAFAWFDYNTEVSRAREHVTETTDALAEHAQKVVETAELVLGRVLDHVQTMDWATIEHSPDVHQFLVQLKEELPQIESVFLAAPDGLNAASSRGFPLTTLSDSSRDYFLSASQGNLGLFVSAPFKGQIAGTYAFTISRPRLQNGKFDGLVAVTLSPAYFEKFYRAVLDHPGQSATALVRDDGALLVRFPNFAARPIRLPPAASAMQAFASGATFSVFIRASAVDGHIRLAGFKRLDGVPLLVSYSMDRSLYLALWYRNLGFFAALACLLSAMIVLAGRAMLAKAAAEHAALARLVEETQRRQEAEAAMQQMQKMEALGRLTGGVAHDFNNLLTAVLGSLELLGKHVSEPRPLRLIATARQAAQRGAQLTAQMLAFSRKQEVEVRPTDVNATITGMTDLLAGAIGPAVRTRHLLAADLPPAMADPAQLEVALLNLAVNARDAMQAGGELTIATGQVSTDGGIPGLAAGAYIRVAVSDTGEGMPEAVRTRVLEPFFTTKGPGKGTGLGLSMVFGFASLMGGSVTVDSAPGKGTTICIFLPQADPDNNALVNIGRILLVDDDETVRMTTSRMLQDFLLEVVEAASGQAALAILERDRQFGVVIVDFAMPQMNGTELANRVRALWPDAPLMFVTGYVGDDDIRHWSELGIPTLSKPFTAAELAAALAEAARRMPASAEVIPLRAAGPSGGHR
jgi:signal transduction histidine kinase/ActR/RegA family two-component response regulator